MNKPKRLTTKCKAGPSWDCDLETEVIKYISALGGSSAGESTILTHQVWVRSRQGTHKQQPVMHK